MTLTHENQWVLSLIILLKFNTQARRAFLDLVKLPDHLKLNDQLAAWKGISGVVPDAIFENDEALVLFEAKVSAPVDVGQLKKYCALGAKQKGKRRLAMIYLVSAKQKVAALRASEATKKEYPEIEIRVLTWHECLDALKNACASEAAFQVLESSLDEDLQGFALTPRDVEACFQHESIGGMQLSLVTRILLALEKRAKVSVSEESLRKLITPDHHPKYGRSLESELGVEYFGYTLRYWDVPGAGPKGVRWLWIGLGSQPWDSNSLEPMGLLISVRIRGESLNLDLVRNNAGSAAVEADDKGFYVYLKLRDLPSWRPSCDESVDAFVNKLAEDIEKFVVRLSDLAHSKADSIDLEVLYRVLSDVARAKKLITYSEVSAEYQTITGEKHEPHGTWDVPLGEINRRANALGLPPISSVVVLKESREPGGNFWGSPGVPPRPRNAIDVTAAWAGIVSQVHKAKWPNQLF